MRGIGRKIEIMKQDKVGDNLKKERDRESKRAGERESRREEEREGERKEREKETGEGKGRKTKV